MSVLQELADRCLHEVKTRAVTWDVEPSDIPAAVDILGKSPEEQAQLAAMLAFAAPDTLSWRDQRMPIHALGKIFTALLRRNLPLGEEGLALLARVCSYTGDGYWYTTFIPPGPLLKRIEEHIATSGLSGEMRAALEIMQASIEPYASVAENRKLWTRMVLLQRGGAEAYPLVPADAWARVALEEYNARTGADRAAWSTLFAFLGRPISKPTRKWVKEANAKIAAVGADAFADALERWVPLFDLPKHDAGSRVDGTYVGMFNDQNLDKLRGLVFCAVALDRPSIATLLGDLAERSYKKIPGIGPMAPKIGNACVLVLGELGTPEATGQLGRLRARVKSPAGMKVIEKTFVAAAERAGLTPEDLEELYVPTLGMTEVGVLRRDDLEITFSGAHDVTAPKQAKKLAKELETLLVAQRDRLDSLYLLRRTWTFSDWRARYLDHPLVGVFARRLIWRFGSVDALWSDGALRDCDGNAVDVEGSTVALWHPIGSRPDAVLAWRQRLEALGITQPFKQAHREVYILTDAEKFTATYSNRFAAHILRQHQFAALCRDRRWRYSLEGGFDSHNTPTITLPAWNLGAEFWVEGVGEDEQQMTAMGIYLYVATDQVRFIDPAGTAVPLPDVPPLVFSEVMRHVDLFVGVASIGNDPSWNDRGDGQHAGYWSTYAFGELSGNASTRRVVLESIVPRLKIADRCSFEDRYLVVRGDLNTYKIHLGSSNILIEPGSRYLCIVPAREKAQKLYVPFEGDSLLSVILSKALLLADDRKIADPTIVRQIREA
jgi:hypothetical protein